MVRKLLFMVLACVLSEVHAQVRTSGDAEFLLIITDPHRDREVLGSPYLNGGDFKEGLVFIDERSPMNLFLRYNVADELMEIKLEPGDDEIFKLPFDEKVVYQIDNQRYVLNKVKDAGELITGFFIEYFVGDKVKFLGKPYATVSKEVKAKSGYGSDKPAEIKIEEKYFIVNAVGASEEIRIKQKDIRRMFIDESSQQYLDDKKIKSKEDLISFLEFYDRT